MDIVGDLVTDVSSRLHSFTGIREQATSLANIISETSIEFGVTDASQITRGVIEIEDEQIEVVGNDSLIRTQSWGRGAAGTAPAGHAAGVKVTNDPTFPRRAILSALNRTSAKIGSDLYMVKSVDLVPAANSGTCILPDNCLRVLSVRLVDPYSQRSQNLRSWNMRPDSPDGSKLLDTYGYPPYQVRCVYAQALGEATDYADALPDLGWSGGITEVVALGAIADMLQTMESSRAQIQSVESETMSGSVPAGTYSNVSKAFQNSFLQAFQLERAKLLNLHESYTHWSI